MKIKEEHKNLKKKVNIEEEKRSKKKGKKRWYEWRTIKKHKLKIKDKLIK